jgi:hypothetical protein
MKIEIDKTQGKPLVFVANYTATLEYDIADLDIDWDKVNSIWCKHTTLFILMDDETLHEIGNYYDLDTDYKWPIRLQLFDENSNQIWED